MTATSDAGASVAVLGTGIMGSAMARNLLKAGFRTAVWDRSASVAAVLAAAGADAAPSPTDAVRDADVVITMLPTPEVVTTVMVDGHVVEAFSQGAAWAQMGTRSTLCTQSLLPWGARQRGLGPRVREVA